MEWLLLYWLWRQQNGPKDKRSLAVQQLGDRNVIVGFLFEWQPGMDLRTIPEGYNVVCLLFSEDGSGLPTLTPKYVPEDELIGAIAEMKAEGRTVLVSLGGSDIYVALSEEDRDVFRQAVQNAVERYGFDGINIDLEGESMTAADNTTVIPEVLRELKEYYRARGKNFVITLSPEFPYLRGTDGLYLPYIRGLEGFYDLIFPQYYNQDGDGIWSEELNTFLAQWDNSVKAEFLYTLTKAIITGAQDYFPIPADKFAIGLPSSPEAAFDGYVENPGDVMWALDRLAQEGTPIRGLMTWSINQDADNGYAFIQAYAPMVFGRSDQLR